MKICEIYIYTLFVCICLFVSDKRRNGWADRVQMYFVGPHVTPGKVYWWSNFQKFASIKIRFLKILKIHEILFKKYAKFFKWTFLLTMYSQFFF